MISPESLHHFRLLDAELRGIHLGKRRQSERPSVQSRRERNGTLVWEDHAISHPFICIRCHDHIGVLDHTQKSSVGLFAIQHEFQKTAIQFVDG